MNYKSVPTPSMVRSLVVLYAGGKLSIDTWEAALIRYDGAPARLRTQPMLDRGFIECSFPRGEESYALTPHGISALDTAMSRLRSKVADHMRAKAIEATR